MNLGMAAENNEKTKQLPRILFPYPDIENIFLHQPSFHPPLPTPPSLPPVYLIQFFSGKPSRCNKGRRVSDDGPLTDSRAQPSRSAVGNFFFFFHILCPYRLVTSEAAAVKNEWKGILYPELFS